MMNKLILLDIDGTLTNHDKKITPRTKEVLLKAERAGARLMLASGRTRRGLLDFADALEMNDYDGYLMCCNGAEIDECRSKKNLFSIDLSVEESRAVLKHLKQFDRARPIIDIGEYMIVEDVYDCMIALNGTEFNVIRYESRGNHFLLKEVPDLSEFIDTGIHKILTFGDPEYLQEHCQAMKEPFGNALSCMFTAPFYFEFMPKGIDKAAALDEVFRDGPYHREDMIAFGDSDNDLSMLRYAGIGIAMGNAAAAVRDIADEVTGTNEEDGIAEALIRHFPELG
ncbi:MAG: HAD family phosphatase [Erysipelotrichia bacterium]|nr:HAD family phosphatase [Erysipelotrichia bacterium]